jgi:glucose-6-phosphate-specific signal transduction histidine kinase
LKILWNTFREFFNEALLFLKNPRAVNPFFTGTILSIVFYLLVVPPVFENPAIPLTQRIIFAASYIVSVSAVAFTSLWIISFGIERFTKKFARRLYFYVGNLFFSILETLLISTFDDRVGSQVVRLIIRLFIGTVFFALVVGIFESKFHRIIEAKESLVVELSHQRELLIQADEKTRDSVAQFLHNTVQSSLVVLGTQLNDLALKGKSVESSQVRSIVLELERVRAIDVRQASRLLTPTITGLTLEQILQPLVDYYSPVMSVKLEISDLPVAETSRVALGIYRVTEQAILNARIHGHAQSVIVTVETSELDEFLILQVENDGDAPRQNYVPTLGFGLTVTETWVSKFEGTWSLLPKKHGAILSATFKRAESANIEKKLSS